MSVEADCAVTEAGTVLEAEAIAAECDIDVTVTDSLTPWQTAVVEAETGHVAVDTAVSAVRQDSDDDGAWAPVDVQIAATPDAATGMLAVTGGVEPIWLNPGGAAGADLPLAVIGPDGDQVRMFSGSLPITGAVSVEDDRVTYDLGEGISLVASLNGQGTSVTPVVRLEDTAALDALVDRTGDPVGELGLDFPLETSAGLTLQESEGGFEIVKSDGTPRFTSGPALMWDSAGGDQAESSPSARALVEQDAPDRVEQPVLGDNVAAMEVQLSENAFTVVADGAALTAPGSVAPFYLDPEMGAHTPARYAMVQSHWPTTATFNYEGSEGLGFCNPSWDARCAGVENTERLLFEFFSLDNNGTYLANLDGADIVSAEFGVDGTTSWDCTSRQVNAYATGRISSATTWSNQPDWGPVQDTWSGTHRAGCSTGRAEFDFTTRAKVQANADESWIAIGLQAANETSMTWWKQYRGDSGALRITYDRPPLAPSEASMDIKNDESAAAPDYDCYQDENRPVLRSDNPTLEARTNDPDGTPVYLQFRVVALTGEQVWQSSWRGPVGPGIDATATVTSGVVKDKEYRWQARAKSTDSIVETTRTLSWDDVPSCRFRVDGEDPNDPKITSSNYPPGIVSGGIGTPIKFTLSPNGSNDVEGFYYGINTTEPSEWADIDPGQSTTGTLEADVTRAGRNFLAAYAYDVSGRTSGIPVQYEFYVGFPHATGIWRFNDAGWQTTPPLVAANSLAGSGTGGLTRTSTVGWGWGYDGVNGTFPPGSTAETGVPDGALVFDAPGDVAKSSKAVVGVDKSFSVSAFLHPSEVTGSAAAVTQEGEHVGSFHLGLSTSADCPTEGEPCWAFWMRNTDDPNSDNTIALVDLPVVVDEWTFVVGVHDATADKIHAYACSAGPNSHHEVEQSDLEDFQPAWNATGPLRLGSGVSDGSPMWQFKGAIDEVRVYEDQVLGMGSDAAAVAEIARLCSVQVES
ncbi:LamG-like jellyroll fold domain-containing protein [Promicromonospora sp. MEB111]|uniref:LamG-like jellyroll fold domain-containing protein n=1 Tax=Promicromonospora sp. MEB111 TaxID=3040301 RepID=UPI00255197F4|nr:LamG-like jellyroll fold domain-containing protein [Promicromonospora sp. MEB111]